MAKQKFDRSKPDVNIGTIGHVDHGKTTLVDEIIKYTHTFRENEDISNLSKTIKTKTEGKIYSMVCFDKEIELKRIIKEENND